MTGVHRVGDIEIDQDHDFQRISWRLQRILWGIMAAMIAAGLLGLFGSGPLSRGSAGEPGAPLRVDYPRFGRYQSSENLEFRVDAGRSGEARIWIDRAYLDAVEIERIEPVPLRVEAGRDRLDYVFAIAAQDAPASVVFSLRPRRIGPLPAIVGLDDHPPIRFQGFIYP